MGKAPSNPNLIEKRRNTTRTVTDFFKLDNAVTSYQRTPENVTGQLREKAAELSMFMLLPLRYPNMEVRPQISISTYLANFGHKVTWVISSEKTGREKTRNTQQFSFNNVHIYVIPYRQHLNQSNVFAKIFNKTIDAFKRIRSIPRIFRERQYNLIFVRDDVFDGLIAAYLKRKYNIPFVFALSNPLEQAWEIYKIESRKPKFLYWAIAKFNTLIAVYVMKKADLILPATRQFEEELTRKGIPKSKLMPYPDADMCFQSYSNAHQTKVHKGKKSLTIASLFFHSTSGN